MSNTAEKGTNLAAAKRTAELVDTLATEYNQQETSDVSIALTVHELHRADGLGLSFARIADLVGLKRAKLAFPKESAGTVQALAAGYAPSRQRMAQLGLGVAFAVESLVPLTDSDVVLAAIQLASRAGSKDVRATITADAADVPVGKRAAWFVKTVKAAMVTVATTKTDPSVSDPEGVTDDQTADEGIGQDGSPVAPLTVSADVLAAMIREAAARTWSDADAAILKSAMDVLFDSIEASIPATV